MKIAVLQDKVKGLWRSLTTEELKSAEESEWKGNRASRRAWWVRTRMKGAGFTRKMRDGREQRERERPRRFRGFGTIRQPAKTERDRYGRGPRRHPHRARRRR